MTSQASETQFGFVAILGAPNAGKSTLLNKILGTKVSMVTHKAQSTRSQIRGVVTRKNEQIVFVDTPGLFKPKRRLDRAMVQAAWHGAADADLLLVVVDARRDRSESFAHLLDSFRRYTQPKILVLNKIDLYQRTSLLERAHFLNQKGAFDQTFMVSALTGDGVADLVDFCAKKMPVDRWHFSHDYLTDLTSAFTAAEVTREKLFLRVHEEIPYGATVETESFKVQKDGSCRIQQIIYVSRESHKRIVLGKNGKLIKMIGQEARKELCDILGHEVHLFLFVKVRSNWADDPERYREMGLEFPR